MEKFKVGDKVTVKGGGDKIHDVTYVYRDGSVQLDNSGTTVFRPMFLMLANSVCNAVIEKKLPPRGAGVYIEQQGALFAVGPTDGGWSVANYGGEGVNFAHGFKTASEAKSWCASKGYKVEDVVLANSLRSRNAVVQKALNATGDGRDYYVVDEFGNAADGSKTPLPFDRASELFLKLTGSKSGNGKWGIIRRGEPASRARDWYGNIVSWNSDTSVLREKAVNAKFKVGDMVGIRNYNGTTWYAKIVSIKSPSEYRVDGIGKSSGLHMDVDGVEIKYVLKKDADGDLVYTPVNSASNGVGVFDGAYVVERTNRDGKFKIYLVNPPNKKPLAEFATREEAERFVADMEKKRSSGVRSTNAVVAKAMNARAVCNASYSAALKSIMDAVKPYMDRRITDDTSWRYPALVISKLRDVCERAVMSAGRYDGKRPPHRVYDVECVKDGFKFSGNLIVSGLLHRDDPDDVSAFDEYDMILSLWYAGKA